MSSAPASIHLTAEDTVLTGTERKDPRGETGGDVWNKGDHYAERPGRSLGLTIVHPMRVGQSLPFSSGREMKGHGWGVLRSSSNSNT